MSRAARRIAIGSAVSVVILAVISVRLDWAAIGGALGRAEPAWIGVAIVALTTNLVVRAARWSTLLTPLGRFSVWSDCFPTYTIGYAANILVPLRAGDLLRAYLFGRRHGLSKTSVLATIVLERIVDILILLVMLAAVVGVTDAPTGAVGTAYGLAGVAVIGLVMARLVAGNHALLVRLDPLVARLPAKLQARVRKSLGAVLDALMTVHDGAAMLRLAGQSVMLWGCAWIVVGSFMKAFGMALPWYAPLLVLTVANLGFMLPATPGNIGVAHVLYMSAVMWLGVDKNLAFAFALLLHGIPHLMIVTVGLAAIWRSDLSIKILGTRDQEAGGEAQAAPRAP